MTTGSWGSEATHEGDMGNIGYMMLSDNHKAILRQITSVILKLIENLSKTDFGEDLQRLKDAIVDIDANFLIVVVGEYNSGKSSFVNALIGIPTAMPVNRDMTTDRIHWLIYSESEKDRPREEEILKCFLKAEFLKNTDLVDTPGTNSINRDQERSTRKFVHRADFVIFVTSIDQPFSESEREFLHNIRQFGQKVIFVLHKIDIVMDDESEPELTIGLIKDRVNRVLGFKPEVLPASSKWALSSIESTGEPSDRSGLPNIQRFLKNVLQHDRFMLKALSPIKLTIQICDNHLKEIAKSRKRLSEDLERWMG